MKINFPIKTRIFLQDVCNFIKERPEGIEFQMRFKQNRQRISKHIGNINFIKGIKSFINNSFVYLHLGFLGIFGILRDFWDFQKILQGFLYFCRNYSSYGDYYFLSYGDYYFLARYIFLSEDPSCKTKKSCYILYMGYHWVYMGFFLRKINLERMQKCHFVTGIIIRQNVLFKVN